MRNTAEKNLSAMSVKWSSKELANPRALSVIYDWEPITSSLLYLPIIWGWQVYLLFFDDQHVKFIEGQVTEAGASGSDLVSSTAPNESFRENGSFYFTPKKHQGKNRTWRSRSESGHCVAWERRWTSSGKLQARIQSCFLWHQRLSRESEAFLFNNYKRSISKTSKKYILFW